MSKKHFSWLLLLTITALILVTLVPSRTGTESTFERSLLVPELAALVNELDYLHISTAGAETIATLERKGGSWQVRELSSYPADWNRLKTLLAALSAAEVVEGKTSNPEYYARLGVQDISQEDAEGVQIEFAAETDLPAIIIGLTAEGREGHYVRIAGEQSSALIDRQLDVPADPMQWLEREIVDVSDAEVVEMSIAHPDGERIAARKVSADDPDFQLLDIPSGSEVKSSWSVNSIGGAMANLSLDQVIPASDIDWSNAIDFSLITADGLQMKARLIQMEEAYWLTTGASAWQAEKAGVEQADEAPTEDVAQRVSQINERVEGWAYRIPHAKFQLMTKRMDDLIQPIEDSAP
jgi:hypothetical protein